ncbi:unnamed protein product [Prunus armeniaca]|uniref:Uncharacterized protein n=1 Tax=Prunus armeniaca TaxID=36596 RepID=A0A6J5WLW3_PRUAR|nr:unnamed protein product [Prunus armeniaca]CAB4300274.1 unnamed protein product [Prunus armeniaca]
MVEDMYLKEQKQGEGLGKFKNCLAVCNITTSFMGEPAIELVVRLGILVFELSEEPAWKRKVIGLGPLPNQLPLLHSIQGDELKSKYEFVKRTCSRKRNRDVNF